MGGTWSSGRSAYCTERDIVAYATVRAFPLIPCTLCGSQPNLQRVAIKRMLHAWAKEAPGRIETIFRSLRHAVPSHLLDPRLFDFAGLSGRAEEQGNEWL